MLLRHRSERLRVAVLAEIGARWGNAVVQLTLQAERRLTSTPTGTGVVAPHDNAAEAEVDASGNEVATHGPDVRLPTVEAAPGPQVHGAPKLLVPAADAPPPRPTTIQVPDADHPSRRDVDGEQVIQTDKASGPGTAAPLRGKSWKSLAELAESVNVQDDTGDTLHIDITYRLESRPAELGDVPDIWIHTERKALLTIASGEHAGATIVGQARVRLAPDEARDPKAALAKASVGADHWAQIYLAEAQQYVNLHGAGGRASLLADAAGDDVLAYDDPLRTLIGLKNILKQQHVAGHGVDVANMHARAQRLVADAKRGCAVLEREIASVATHHDAHPGRIAPVRFLIGDIAAWLETNQQAGRDDTEDTRRVNQAHAELLRLLDAAEHAHAPKRDQLDDGLNAPVRFAERTAEGAVEVGAMTVDAIVLGVDALGDAMGIGTFEYHPISKYGKSVEASGADTSTALVTMVNGFADEWSDAIERAKHGDYRSLTDVSIDTLMLIDGARTGGVIALQKAEELVGRLGSVARSARALASGLPVEARDIAAVASRLPFEVRNIASAMADGADAFVARLRAGDMQMSMAGSGGGPGPNLGGLKVETLSEAAQAAKEAFKGKRLSQQATKEADKRKRPSQRAPEVREQRAPYEVGESEIPTKARELVVEAAALEARASKLPQAMAERWDLIAKLQQLTKDARDATELSDAGQRDIHLVDELKRVQSEAVDLREELTTAEANAHPAPAESTVWGRRVEQARWDNHGNKHTKAMTAEQAKQFSTPTDADPAPASQYLPDIDVQALETRALREGEVYQGDPNNPSSKVFLWFDSHELIGYDRGKAVTTMRVELTSGTYHGHPRTAP
jgi:hypothetical protein